MSSSDLIDFHFAGGIAGAIISANMPKDGGKITYSPNRSGSHLLLQSAIAAAENPECTFSCDGRSYRFSVTDCPDYGQLIVGDVLEIDP